MTRLDAIVDHIRRSREYTKSMLDHIPLDDWFRQPTEGVTHVAWQVGHLAFAEHRLGLERVRGTRDTDEDLISTPFRKLFGKGSQPDPHPSHYPSTHAIREVFDRVHQEVLAELSHLSDAALDETVPQPHPRFTTKQGALWWCGQHEMIHAGQLGLLRRLLGHGPIW